jgi:hypothetical protein
MPYGSIVADKFTTSDGYTVGGSGAHHLKNRIINGAMTISQRNGSTSVTPTSGSYVIDRFYYAASQASKVSFQQSTDAPTGFSFSSLFTTTTAASTVAGDYYEFVQPIEGFNTADLSFGTSSAKAVTLSFWVKSSLTGTFSGAIQNAAGNRSYPFTYTISAASTWEQKVITIAGDTTGTWVGATNGVGLYVRQCLGLGTTYSGSAFAWQAGGYDGVAGGVNVIATNGATWQITGVQLEAGSTNTSFDYRHYGVELAMCHRYFQKFLGTESAEILRWSGVAYNTTSAEGPLAFKQTMRSAPTFSSSTIRITDGVTNYTAGTFAMDSIGLDSGRMYCYGNSGITQFRPYYCQANNSTSAYVYLSAEL